MWYFQHDILKMHDVLSVMFLRKRGVLSMRFEVNVMFSALYLGRKTWHFWRGIFKKMLFLASYFEENLMSLAKSFKRKTWRFWRVVLNENHLFKWYFQDNVMILKWNFDKKRGAFSMIFWIKSDVFSVIIILLK